MAQQLTDDFLKWTLDIDGKPAINQLGILEQNTRSLEKTNKDLRVEMQKLEAQMAKNPKNVKELQKQYDLLSDKLKENNKTIGLGKARMAELRQEVGLNALTAKQLRSEYKRLKNQLDNTTPNTKEWKQLDGQLQAVKKRQMELNGVTKKTNSIFGALKKALPIISIGAVVTGVGSLLKNMGNLALKMEGETRRASIVFGDSLSYVEEQADLLAKKMGVTNHEFVSMAANTADLLIPLDFTRDKAAEMSVELQSLTGALDEWTSGQIGATEISNILTKAMLGENEQLKQLGIAIRKDSDEYRNLVKQKIADEGVTKAQAEAMATLELIQRKSIDAQQSYNTEGNKLLRWKKSLNLQLRQAKENFIGLFDVEEEQVDLTKLHNTELNSMFDALKNTNLSQDARRKLIEQINDKYGQYLPNLLTEKSTLEDIEKAQKAVNDQIRIGIISRAMQEEIVELLKEEKNAVERLVQSEIDASTAQQKLISSTDELTATQAKQQLEFSKLSNELNQTIVNNVDEQEKKIREKYEKIAAYYKIAFSEIENAVNGINNLPAPEKTLVTDPKEIEKQLKLAEDAIKKSSERRLLELTIARDAELLTEQQFSEQKNIIALAELEARKALYIKYGEDITDIQTDILEKRYNLEQQFIEEFNALTDQANDDIIAAELERIDQQIANDDRMNEEILAKRYQLYQNQQELNKQYLNITKDFSMQMGELMGAALTDGIKDFEEFGKQMILIALDFVKKSIQLAIAQATGFSLASPESVLTAGVAGIAKAALLTGLIEGAFQVAKNAITNSNTTTSGFFTGGDTGTGGKYEPAGIVHKNEYVIAQEEYSHPQIRQFVNSVIEPSRLSRLNNQAISNSMNTRGFFNGGDTSAPSQTITSKELMTMLKLLTTQLSRPIRANVIYDEYRDTDDKIRNIENDASIY